MVKYDPNEEVLIWLAHKSLTSEQEKALADTTSVDKRFYLAEENIIEDTEIGLEWYFGSQKIKKDEAMAWVKALKLGGRNWRLPNERELQVLCGSKGIDSLAPLFKIDFSSVWADEDGSISEFCFADNAAYLTNRRKSCVFAVSSTKEEEKAKASNKS